MNEQNDKFSYTYQAPSEQERREINSIRKEYTSTGTGGEKFARLEKLDARVKAISSCVGLSLGIGGCLVFGLGITMILEWSDFAGVFAGGIVVGCLGILLMAIAYPAQNFALKRAKNKYRNEIISLTDDILNK